jgi:heme/copper-type cytochrome/quinol oxidase subunit 3
VTDHAVPRSMEATGACAAARIERGRVARPNGWWGMAIFVATEATLFGTIFGTYYYLRFETPLWPPAGVPHPKVAVPLVLTGVLVATSGLVQLAFFAARRAQLPLVRLLLLTALIVQSGYFAMQIHLFADDLQSFKPSGSAYGSIYYTLVGAHHAHVLVGILLNAWLLLRLLPGITDYRLVGLQTITFYWHFVNVLAVFVVLTQVSPSL